MASTPTQLMTFQEFERLPDPREGFYELQHGELILMAPPKQRHKRIQVLLRDLLASSAEADVWIPVTEYGFRPVGDLEYRIAEAVLISRKRWNETDLNGYFQGTPELVIEVLSPSNTVAEMREKRDICLRNGAREFWLVDPDSHTVDVSTPNGHTQTYRAGERVPLFWGGTLNVDEIFV